MSPNASEVVQEIPTDEKKLSQMLHVRYSFHISTAYSVEKVGC